MTLAPTALSRILPIPLDVLAHDVGRLMGVGLLVALAAALVLGTMALAF